MSVHLAKETNKIQLDRKSLFYKPFAKRADFKQCNTPPKAMHIGCIHLTKIPKIMFPYKFFTGRIHGLTNMKKIQIKGTSGEGATVTARKSANKSN